MAAPNAGVPRSSASTTSIQSCAARAIAALRCAPIEVNGCEKAVAPAVRARASVSSVESFSTTRTSSAQATLATHSSTW
jgi:hypothetical protein